MLLFITQLSNLSASLGWAIANSIWQAGLLWVIFQLFVKATNLQNALLRYTASSLFLLISGLWFVATIFQQYRFLAAGGANDYANWIQLSDQFHTCLQWMSGGYVAALCILLARFTKSLMQVGQLTRNQMVKPPVDIRIFTEQTAFHLGIKKKVQVWLSNQVDVPSVVGFFKPVILLPVTCLNQLTTAQAESILLHELAHIQRNDYLANLLQRVVEMLLFFNPFARMLGNVARLERENCCDDWVLNFRYNQQDYAAALVILEKNRGHQLQLALAATNGKQQLFARVKRLFNVQPCVELNTGTKFTLGLFTALTVLVMWMHVPAKNSQLERLSHSYPVIPSIPAIATVQKVNEVSVVPINTVAIGNKEVKTPHIQQRGLRLNRPALPAAKRMTQTMLINSELLEEPANNATVAVANFETTPQQNILVQVEEEQSGSEEKTRYMVMVGRDGNGTKVTPLILLNKKYVSDTTQGKKSKSVSKQRRIKTI